MKGKAALVLGAATGYVFGAKAGTQRYEQIKAKADRLWRDPRVQDKAAQAQDLAKQKAPELQEKATQAAAKAKGKATKKRTSATTTAPEVATPATEPLTVPDTPLEASVRPTPSAPQSGGISGGSDV